MSTKQRLIRVLVYEGDPEWIAECLRMRGIKGSRAVRRGVIKEVVVGDFLEVLIDQPPSDEQEWS